LACLFDDAPDGVNNSRWLIHLDEMPRVGNNEGRAARRSRRKVVMPRLPGVERCPSFLFRLSGLKRVKAGGQNKEWHIRE